METTKRLINKFKFIKLRKMLKNFNKPGEGGSVASLLETKNGEPVLLIHNEDQAGPLLNYRLLSIHWGKFDQSLLILF